MLTVENVKNYLLESEETVEGHMHHQRQGVRSTKRKDFQEPNVSSEIGKKERDVYICKSSRFVEPNRNYLHIPNLSFSHHCPEWGKIYHGNGHNRCQCNLVVSDKKQD